MIKDGLVFDDVLLIPKHSSLKSRADVDLSVKLAGRTYNHPIIPANMKTVTGEQMAEQIAETKGLSILHRFMPIEDQINIATKLVSQFSSNYIGVSVGVKNNDKEIVSMFHNAGVKIICIDIAHGDSSHCIDMTAWIKTKYPDTMVIAGNVATGQGAINLWESGADVVKVGVGPGSLCTTRIETGNGVPQLTAIMEVAEARQTMITRSRANGENKYFPFIADGGLKNSGDISKALCFADMVMAGNLFAGCEETPGEILLVDGIPHKHYVGSSTHKANHIEGVAAFMPCKAKFKDVLGKLLEGVRSGCSYQGATNLTEMKRNPNFVRITNAGLKESLPHNVRL
jgi:IMP dehydrogenase